MKTIQLTQNKIALVDDNDFEYLSQWKWRAHFNRKNWYALYGKDGLRMHRLLLSLSKNDKRQVDHINGNGLDNRRCNLRVCTCQQNTRNRKKHKNSASKYKGVFWYGPLNKWVAKIWFNNKSVHLGYFKSEKEAALIYDIAAKVFFKEFARTNQIIEQLQNDNQQFRIILQYALLDAESLKREKAELQKEIKLLQESLLDGFKGEDEGV